jgi:hypothetical protein
VFGQQDFISAVAATTQNGMNYPWGATIDRPTNTLWVCDTGNHRVLKYTASAPLPVKAESRQDPDQFALLQNYPNPFNPSTTIEFALPQTSTVALKVLNILGEKVAILFSGEGTVGNFTATWDASDMPSGAYFFRLTAGEYVQTRKAVLMK